MRAGDADRQAVADSLKPALDEGRLDLHEYDERLQRAYAAKTYGDLDGLLDRSAAGTRRRCPAPSQVQPHGAGRHGTGATRGWLVETWGSWRLTVARSRR